MSQVYHHIDIGDNCQKYLGFSWKIDSKISYFMFIVLPFSLNSPPFSFTKVMRCLLKILEKGRDKTFTYSSTTVLHPSPLPLLDLARNKQNSLKTVWLNVALL